MKIKPNSANPVWTIEKVLGWSASYFNSHEIDSPRATAEMLLANTLKTKRIDLYLNYDKPLLQDELQQFKQLLKRRINREPVAYITGSKGFWSLDLTVTPDVLIPRPETECLVEAALQHMSVSNGMPVKRILELGTGSGAIVIALAVENEHHCFFASDRSVGAIEIAAANAKAHHLGGRIGFFCADWLDALATPRCSLDMIVSNPPYIRQSVIPTLQPEIVHFEPVSALDGGKDGLLCLQEIIGNAHAYLKPGGLLMLEIGHDQKNEVEHIAAVDGRYEEIIFFKDYAGHDRVVQMRTTL